PETRFGAGVDTGGTYPTGLVPAAFWEGPAITTGTLYGLQVSVGNNGELIGYEGFASSPLAVTDGAPVTANLALDLLANGSGSVTGNVTVPTGSTLDTLGVSVDLSMGQANLRNAIISASIDQSGNPSFNVPVPDLTGAKLFVRA